ncbi:hypothetical protein KXV50_001247 [Aspergillus fumigatus]|nr:hypothetical protein CNMCM8686_000756 [Aspergillus fumigatus]KAH1679302.1 hypothetical protein KXX65_000139 [Aspergillus fumigatus]KAH1846848.1 hypothetical protein KXX54_008956 [Aspergillus fumigatus]KAH1925454.1 hypothetical protein KXW47_003632 [Aspergillus fumigatus]KAH2081851.1 hypothetical protein KXX03_003991 [Aspergillus fumigatus]
MLLHPIVQLRTASIARATQLDPITNKQQSVRANRPPKQSHTPQIVMSFLTSVRASITHRVAIRPSYRAVSAFHNSPARLGLKESDGNRDDLDSYYEAEKEDLLKSTKEGKAKWKGELASNSEASVKADRGELDSDDKDFQSLQSRTKDLPNRSGPVNKTQ